jgi:hypothetical protein
LQGDTPSSVIALVIRRDGLSAETIDPKARRERVMNFMIIHSD